jgi:hypothetical protein
VIDEEFALRVTEVLGERAAVDAPADAGRAGTESIEAA